MTRAFALPPPLKTLAAPVVLWRAAAAMRGALGPASGAPSLLVFTTQKCASTFLPQALSVAQRFAAPDQRLRPVDLARYLRHVQGDCPYAVLNRAPQTVFRAQGFAYAPLRAPVHPPDLAAYRFLVFLRDPRDVIVSNYYSLAFSHPLPGHPAQRAEMLARRARARQQSLDAYVLENMDRFLGCYQAYQRLYLQMPQVQLLTYEQMSQDFGAWARQFLRALKIAPCDRAIDALARVRGPDPATALSDDTRSHRRNGKPGEAARRLQPKTWSALQDRYATILRDYAVWPMDRADPV